MLKNLGGRKVAQARPKTWRKEPNIAPLRCQGILKQPYFNEAIGPRDSQGRDRYVPRAILMDPL